jgi:hypothetical protein
MRLSRIFGVAGAVVGLGSCGFQSGVPNAAPAGSAAIVPPYTVLPLVGVSAAQLEEARAARRTIPFFAGSIKSPLDGKTYDVKIVGNNPRTSSGTTAIPYVPIVLVVHFLDGTVLDPEQPACNDAVSVERRVLNGPNFVATVLHSNGDNIGNAQLGDALQRAEFWKILKSSQYHTVLRAARGPVVVHVNAPSSSRTTPGVCSGTKHRIGEIPFGEFTKIAKTLIAKYVTTGQVAILLTYNTFELLPSGCCFLGFHGAIKRPSGIQVMAVAAYNDRGTYGYIPKIADISIMTHEIGELLNDPFISNATPAWGDVGQYPFSCSNILEVGDPLTGTQFDVRLGGFTYHPQELTFFSWFFRTRSIGTGGKYSFLGTFTKPQGVCR